MKCVSRFSVRATLGAVGASLRPGGSDWRPRTLRSLAIRCGAVLGALVLTGGAIGRLTAGADGQDATPTLAPPVGNRSPGDQETRSPFNFTGPGGAPESLAQPVTVTDLPATADIAQIRRLMPEARFLPEPAHAVFRPTAFKAKQDSEGYLAFGYYSDDALRRFVSVASWNQVGSFNMVVPVDSPVAAFELTVVDGLHALTILPTTRVVGGLAPREVFLAYRGSIYAIYGEGFTSNESFMELVHSFISEVKK